MSFLKITDPVKREQIVKDYLATSKRIRDSQLAERTGEIELQTGLSKFFKPISETQKASTKEITEGLKPIKEGIEQLPQAINFPAFPSIVAYEESEDKDEEPLLLIGPVAAGYLRKFATKSKADTTFGLRDEDGKFHIGDKKAEILGNDILVEGITYEGTPGFWELVISKNPDESKYTDEDYKNYSKLIKQTNAVYTKNDPNSGKVRHSKSYKWINILNPIWEEIKAEREGKGITIIPSDPNALLERLDLLMASKEAGNTGVRNELVSICDELKRQGIFDSRSYKNLMSLL